MRTGEIGSPLRDTAGDAFAWSLLDASPDGVLLVSDSGEICFASGQASSLFGYSDGELIGLSVDLLLPSEVRGQHRAHRTRYRASPSVRAMGVELDLRALRRDGVESHAEISLSPLMIEGDDYVLAAVRDISDRVAAEDHLRRILHTLDASDDAIALLEAESLRFSYTNQGAARLYGYSSDELTLMSPLHLDPYATEGTYRDLVDHLLADPGAKVRREARIVRKDGEEVPVEQLCQAGPPTRDGNRLIVVLARDISERLEREAQLEEGRALLQAAERTMIQTEERSRIARDLHDTVIQRLFAAGLGLQSIIPQADQAVAHRLEQTISDLDATIDDLRAAIHSLNDPRADEGLNDRLMAILSHGNLAGLRSSYELRGSLDQVGQRIVAHLIPTLREAASNVIRHAHASRVDVLIEVEDGWLELQVRDDGIGPGPRTEDGHGLSNLSGRAEQLGGVAALLQREGGGSTFRWRVPLPSTDDPDIATAERVAVVPDVTAGDVDTTS